MKQILLVALILCCLLVPNLANAHPGIGIVMDQEGNIYYTDLVHVWKITPEGTRSIAVKDVHTHELFLDTKGDLYGEHEWYEGEATDKWGNYVWCLTKDGEFKKVIPDVEGFLDNTTLVRDTNGNSYWSKKEGEVQTLMKQTPNGTDHQFSDHAFEDIRWMHFSENDYHLYVVDHLSVKRVDMEGKVEVVSEDLKKGSALLRSVADRHYVFGLWTDPKMNTYVALYGAGTVKRIDPDGEATTVFSSPMGWSPCGGLIAKDGTMWIMEFSRTNKTRVRKILADGRSIVYGEE